MTDLASRLLAALDQRDKQVCDPRATDAIRAKIDQLGPVPPERTGIVTVTLTVELWEALIAASDPSSWLRMSTAWRVVIANLAVQASRHRQAGHEDGWCDCCDLIWPCADYNAAQAGLSAIAEALGVEP